MYLEPLEYVQLEILLRGAAEPLTLGLVRSIVEHGSCVIDVGAHVGHHTLEAAIAAGRDGRVFGFDPQPYNADRIGRHAVLNNLENIVTVCAAVGDKDGFVMLPMQSERDRARLSLHEAGPNNQDALI
jgi:FkbM family methyltransferase